MRGGERSKKIPPVPLLDFHPPRRKEGHNTQCQRREQAPHSLNLRPTTSRSHFPSPQSCYPNKQTLCLPAYIVSIFCPPIATSSPRRDENTVHWIRLFRSRLQRHHHYNSLPFPIIISSIPPTFIEVEVTFRRWKSELSNSIQTQSPDAKSDPGPASITSME